MEEEKIKKVMNVKTIKSDDYFAAFSSRALIFPDSCEKTKRNKPLKITIDSDSFPKTVEKLKELIDKIVAFANFFNIIEVPDKYKVTNDRGLNPTDHLLYYCEIEEFEANCNHIRFYVSPICDNEIIYKNIKNFPGFECRFCRLFCWA